MKITIKKDKNYFTHPLGGNTYIYSYIYSLCLSCLFFVIDVYQNNFVLILLASKSDSDSEFENKSQS